MKSKSTGYSSPRQAFLGQDVNVSDTRFTHLAPHLPTLMRRIGRVSAGWLLAERHPRK